uniref:MD-2-related lipid-recognition domain-containing protein n=1 Tax=Stomoxys calcitrans TaxID=35570 RepID=A0A1I8P909_STOCA
MKHSSDFVLALLTILCGFVVFGKGVFLKFTNLECESFDKSLTSFDKCRLKALGRHNVSLNIYIKFNPSLYPMNNIKINAQFHQRGSFGPYIYNDTMSFCEFMKNPKRWMFWKIIWEAILPATNMNHSCPVNHDVIIKDLSLKEDMMTMIPFPPNTYQIRLRFFNSTLPGFECRMHLTVY